MNFNQPSEELIELYLRGELSPAESSALESQISTNPELSRQVSFQRDITRGIGEYRKAQLKARLDLIEVAPSPFSVGALGSNTLYKMVGGVAVASLVGIGIYFYPYGQSTPSEVALVEISSTTETEILPKIPEVVIPQASDAETVKPEETKSTRAIPANKQVEPIKQEEDFSPAVAAPNLEDVSDKVFNAEKVESPESVAETAAIASAEPIEVKTIESSGELRYKYFEGDLYLYGDFKKTPYEILEINSKTSREIYLYHASNYYKIEQTNEVKALRAITNEGLIRDLTIIRTDKSE